MKRLTWMAACLPWMAACLLLFVVVMPAAADDPSPSELFEKLDKNQDGELTSDEIASEQKVFFERATRLGDKNEDGKLTRDEFVSGLSGETSTTAEPKAEPQRTPEREGRAERGRMMTRWDRDGNGTISRDEIPEPLRDRFSRVFDEAGKDELTPEELRQGMGWSFAGRSLQALREMDKNNDGKITRDEVPEESRERMNRVFDRMGLEEIDLERFEQFTQQRGERGDRPGQPRPKGPNEADKNRRSGPPNDNPEGDRPRPPFPGRRIAPAFLRVLDTDEDGMISRAELAETEKLFAELDHNQDGNLDGPELMGFPGPRGSEDAAGRDDRSRRPEGDGPPRGFGGESRNVDPNRFFNNIDQDGDGFISEDEAPGRMKDRFSEIDTDSDGKISQEEFTRNREEMRRRFQEGGFRPGRGNRGEGSNPPNRPQRPE